MRVVALEEHVLFPDLVERHEELQANLMWLTPEVTARLSDVGEGRVRDMDEHGVDVQVLSASMPGADLVEGARGVAFAAAVNDRIAQAVSSHPTRFAGLAHLPTREPAAAADELERAVTELGFRGAMINGLSDGAFLDDPRFAVLLERAEGLDVPLYLHPNLPPAGVADAYYRDLPSPAGELLATGLFGWHAEVAVHVLRLALSGTTERFPGLRLIVGHMGEMLPAALGRADAIAARSRLFAGSLLEHIAERVHITTRGVFPVPPLLAAVASFGIDRIMFSVD
jgi:predicted TIM-barrel fold metal-dependent hydrolase